MRKFNFDELLWFIVLILINASIIFLIHSSKMSFYIGEKMVKHMYFAIIALFILSIFQIPKIFTSKSSTSIKLKILPMIFVLIIGFIAVNNQNKVIHNELFDNILKECEHEENISYKINKDGIIDIDDDNIDILDDIKSNHDKYKGKKVSFQGFVCKEQYLKNNQFLIGKVIITCCGADSNITGFLVQYDKCSDLLENDTIYIEGLIDYTTVSDESGKEHTVPVINVINLKKQPKVND